MNFKIQNESWTKTFYEMFLGNSPNWYKNTILIFLLINPILFAIDPFVSGWVLVAQFIFTLAMALKCYPLQSGGLLAVEALFIGMTNTHDLLHEISLNLPVLLLLIFMVAAIYFMQELLEQIFTSLIVKVRSKWQLSVIFMFMGAVLSAIFDAMTVAAVLLTVSTIIHMITHKFLSGKSFDDDHTDDDEDKMEREDARIHLDDFRAFLRNILMHALVGTALGGAMTMVGEPQNLIIAKIMNWGFTEFFAKMAIVSIPVLIIGLTTNVLLETTVIGKWFGYQKLMPSSIMKNLVEYQSYQKARITKTKKARILLQSIAGLFLVYALAIHWGEVGIIGLVVLIFITATNGITNEHSIGKAFLEPLPFVSLLAVFFVIIGVIENQHLLQPIIDMIFGLPPEFQPIAVYGSSGLTSTGSDNVFVATVFIKAMKEAFDAGILSQEMFDKLAIATNMGTNIPSVGTPNGQAAFLFALTSSIAMKIKLDYMTMLKLAFPYFVTMSIIGGIMVYFFL